MRLGGQFGNFTGRCDGQIVQDQRTNSVRMRDGKSQGESGSGFDSEKIAIQKIQGFQRRCKRENVVVHCWFGDAEGMRFTLSRLVDSDDRSGACQLIDRSHNGRR